MAGRAVRASAPAAVAVADVAEGTTPVAGSGAQAGPGAVPVGPRRPTPVAGSTPGVPVRAGWARAASVVALLALAAHGLTAFTHAHELTFSLLVGLMGVLCAFCAVRCLRSPCGREVTALLWMSAAMVGVHVAWVLASGGAGHSHAGAAHAGHAASGMAGTMLGLALIEVVVAALCALALRARWR